MPPNEKNSKVSVREMYEIVGKIRGEIADNHLEVMKEIVTLKVWAAVWGGVGGIIVSVITAIIIFRLTQ